MFAPKSIVELSPQQSALITSLRQKWQRIIFSTEPLNKEKAAQAIRVAYTTIGQPLPEIIFASSPIAAFDKIVTSKSRSQKIADLAKYVEAHSSASRSREGQKLTEKIESLVDNNAVRKVGKLLEMTTSPEQELASIFYHKINHQLGNLSSHQLPSQLELIAQKTKSQLEKYLANQLKVRVMSQLVSQLEKQLGREQSQLLCQRLSLELEGQPHQLLKLQFLQDQSCWFDFAVSALNCYFQPNQWQAFQQLALDCGAIYTSEDYCIVCDRPLQVHGHAHGHLQPIQKLALEFRDGSMIFSDGADILFTESQQEKEQKIVAETPCQPITKKTTSETSSQQIKFLTPKQKALIPAYYQKWCNLIFNPQSPKPETMEKTIKFAYTALGKQAPEIIIFQNQDEMFDAIIASQSIQSALRNFNRYLSQVIRRQLGKELGSSFTDNKILKLKQELKKELTSIIQTKLNRIFDLVITSSPIYQLKEKLLADLPTQEFQAIFIDLEKKNDLERVTEVIKVYNQQFRSKILSALVNEVKSNQTDNTLALEIVNNAKSSLFFNSISLNLDEIVSTVAWLDFCIYELSFAVNNNQWRAFQLLAKYGPIIPEVNGKCFVSKFVPRNNNDIPKDSPNSTLAKISSLIGKLGIFSLRFFQGLLRIIYNQIKQVVLQVIILLQKP